MKYYSTRDAFHQKAFSLREAAFMGLAPDGALFVPERIPQVDMSELVRRASISYAEMACYLAGLFFGDEIPSEVLFPIIRRAYDFSCPLRHMEAGIYCLELFHGPTFAFKDFGARFMGGMLGLLNDSDNPLTVLTATSGDTGSAVAAGFYGVPGVDVVVLYPEGKVSDIQESQMTTLGDNIHPVRVRGSFDDCQALVKAVFNDSGFRSRRRVTSANSINILRWIPQSFYYFYAWCQWHAATGRDFPDIVVPSGNYGNITAGMLAQRMGLPVNRWIAASNSNDVVPQFLKTGEYQPRASVRTMANAMDVGAPSNFERMLYLFGGDISRIMDNVSGFSCDDDGICRAIREIFSSCDAYVSDPHSAIAFAAARKYAADGFYLSTAHPAKFPEIIEPVLGFAPEMPERFLRIMALDKEFVTMDNDLLSLQEFMLHI